MNNKLNFKKLDEKRFFAKTRGSENAAALIYTYLRIKIISSGD